MYGMRIEPRDLPLHMQEQVAMSFLAQAGPIVPGPRGDHNMAELAFHNGQEKRTEEVITMMMEIRTRVKGEQYSLLTELIDRVRKL